MFLVALCFHGLDGLLNRSLDIFVFGLNSTRRLGGISMVAKVEDVWLEIQEDLVNQFDSLENKMLDIMMIILTLFCSSVI